MSTQKLDDVIETEEELIFNPFNPLNKEVPIRFVCDILKKYGVPDKVHNINLYKRSFVHKSYCKKSKEENINADVFGPLAFDNTVSKKSAAIKKIKNDVAGNADILLVPNVESGNALVKMMIYFMGACAAGVVIGGKVPVVITSRSDESEARLASIAAAVVALET